LLQTTNNVSQADHSAENLVAHWTFDDNSGGTIAVSATDSPTDDGTFNGPGISFRSDDLAPIAGKVSVLDFDGRSGNYVSTEYQGILGSARSFLQHHFIPHSKPVYPGDFPVSVSSLPLPVNHRAG